MVMVLAWVHGNDSETKMVAVTIRSKNDTTKPVSLRCVNLSVCSGVPAYQAVCNRRLHQAPTITSLSWYLRFISKSQTMQASLVAQRYRLCLPTQETQVWSLGREDPLEKELATHSSTLAWEIPQTEEPGRLRSTGLQRVRHDLGVKQVRHCNQSIPCCFISPLSVVTAPNANHFTSRFLSFPVSSLLTHSFTSYFLTYSMASKPFSHSESHSVMSNYLQPHGL